MKEEYFDWTELEYPECEYEVSCPDHSDGVEHCGGRAFYQAWWSEDGKDAMNLCQEHFDFVIKCEAENDKEKMEE